MPRSNVGAAHMLFGAWLLLVIQSVLPDMVLCAKPGMPVNLEFASLDARCECDRFAPASGGENTRFLRADDSCSDSPFVTDFGKTTSSSGTVSGCGAIPEMAGICRLTAESGETPRFRYGFGPRRVPLFFQPLSDALRC